MPSLEIVIINTVVYIIIIQNDLGAIKSCMNYINLIKLQAIGMYITATRV